MISNSWHVLEGTTIESAKKNGAMWLRDFSNGCKEVFKLPAGYFKNLDALPPGELAYVMFQVMKHEMEK